MVSVILYVCLAIAALDTVFGINDSINQTNSSVPDIVNTTNGDGIIKRSFGDGNDGGGRHGRHGIAHIPNIYRPHYRPFYRPHYRPFYRPYYQRYPYYYGRWKRNASNESIVIVRDVSNLTIGERNDSITGRSIKDQEKPFFSHRPFYDYIKRALSIVNPNTYDVNEGNGRMKKDRFFNYYYGNRYPNVYGYGSYGYGTGYGYGYGGSNNYYRPYQYYPQPYYNTNNNWNRWKKYIENGEDIMNDEDTSTVDSEISGN